MRKVIFYRRDPGRTAPESRPVDSRLSFAKNRQEYLAQRKRRKAAAAEEEAGVGVEEEQQAASRELL